MSSEQRDIRAIGSVAALDDLVSGARLFVGDSAYGSGESIFLDDMTYRHASIKLDLGGCERVEQLVAASIADLESLDLHPRHLEFAVILSSRYLRILETRHRHPLEQLADAADSLVLTSGERPKALRAPRSGATVELSIHLAEERPRHPLRPWRLASWIARTSWSVTTESGFSGFTPKPLTPDKKIEFGLAKRAVRYVTLSGSPFERDVTEDAVEVWIDSDLLAKISANPKTKQADALQRQLFVDAISTVVAQAGADPEFKLAVWADVKSTLLGRVVSLVCPNQSSEMARDAAGASFLAMLKSDPAQFLTYVEDAAGLGSAYEAGLDG